MRKVKTPEELIKKRWKKLREAVRNVWQYDHERRAVITAVSREYSGKSGKFFHCPLCAKEWPIELATVDHDPNLGGFQTWDEFFSWTLRCFTGPQRAICKPCHRQVTAKQRKKGKTNA